jgi:hypothetical protein
MVCLLAHILIFAQFQAADIRCRSAEVTGKRGGQQ